MKQRRKRKCLWIAISVAATLGFGITVCMWIFSKNKESLEGPEQLLLTYMECIPKQNYGQMYQMIDVEASGQISQEDFIKRNSAIYEGIEMRDMEITVFPNSGDKGTVRYQTEFDTSAGKVSFENKVMFHKGEDGYRLVWDDSLIYPRLHAGDKVRVSTIQAKRGEILDRNGRVLAGKGVASSVGIVPGKLDNRDGTIGQAAALLGMEPQEIEKKLSAKWVKDDSFVPIKLIPKVEEIELMTPEPDAEVVKEQERQRQLLEIPGVMVSDTEVRTYPLGEAAAHLVGYIQGVTAEDLEGHPGEGYTENSVIGKSGAEGLFETELKGQDGRRIFIEDAKGNEKEELACKIVEHGKNITLTIDSRLQTELYQQFRQDKGCSVAMDPYTGEVLALVSTPSYDNNDFILGFSSEEWASLNDNADKPMYNRFRQAWCPGSTLKPVVAAIGLDSGAVDPNEDYGDEGPSWQKDASWGSYFVTTLHTYQPVVLENALVYSDNIYFAKAALKIGAEQLKESLLGLGFQKELPFEVAMSKSQYSNTEDIETEIQLADSGYGQGQVLANPLHLACIYTAFCNSGNMVKPYLAYSPQPEPEYWIPEAFSSGTAEVVRKGMEKVVNDPSGTGYGVHREDVLLAGKTGTAEIKASKEDDSGTELGWLAVFTSDHSAERPILILSMVEDVKGRGGSGYVVEGVRQVLEGWFGKPE